MSQEETDKQHCQLMSDSSQTEEEGEEAALCGDNSHEQDTGLCGRLFRSKTARLGAMLFLILGYFLAEVIVGHITNSLTLLADSFHMLSDALSLIVALVAVRMSRRTAKDPFKPWPSKEPYFNTFGWVRFEILGALINSTFLLALCVSIFLEAIEKFMDPKKVKDPKLVLIVGGGGLAINILGLIMFGSHSHGHSHGHEHNHSHGNNGSHEEASGEEQEKKILEEEHHLNMRAVFLHVLGDALGSVIVMISATVIWLVPEGNDWTEYMDPSMSLLLVCIMVFTTIPLFKQSSLILLQTVPKHIKLEQIRKKLTKIAGIQAIHDLHIWQLTGEKIVATVHVRCANAETYLTLVQKIREALHHEGIHSFTVQPEFSYSDEDPSTICQLVCGESCMSKTCCPQDNPKSDKRRSPSNSKLTNGTARVSEQQATYAANSDVMQIKIPSPEEDVLEAAASNKVVPQRTGSEVINMEHIPHSDVFQADAPQPDIQWPTQNAPATMGYTSVSVEMSPTSTDRDVLG